MAETPKRLTPKPESLRELFAKSGNLCAFPGCNHLIFDREGHLIAQICHIEAAEPGGERFNLNQTNEERRHISNLMLMCYEHHVVTNNVETYTVDRMRTMKANHEAKFTGIENRLEKAFTDESQTTKVHDAKNLRRINAVLKWGLDEVQLAEMVEQLSDFTETLREMPERTRTLLAIIVDRVKMVRGDRHLSVLHREIVEVTRVHDREIVEHVGILADRGIAFGERDEESRNDYIRLYELENGWKFWEELKCFCKETGNSLHDIVVGLNFSALDE